MAAAKNSGTHGLRLVQTSPRSAAAPVLRASIIEGTGGGGVYPMPAALQKAVDRKAKLLANDSFELIRESIMRELSHKCFIGARSEICLEDKAFDLLSRATLDSVLAPIAHIKLESVLSTANFLLHFATCARDDIQKEVQRFRGI